MVVKFQLPMCTCLDRQHFKVLCTSPWVQNVMSCWGFQEIFLNIWKLVYGWVTDLVLTSNMGEEVSISPNMLVFCAIDSKHGV